ncbi:MAG TPA: hypothetical protein VEQ36_14200 [Thermomicrobiales bacterium]|nr:hypothetical protein [Thermomicrobiales bacterium]
MATRANAGRTPLHNQIRHHISAQDSRAWALSSVFGILVDVLSGFLGAGTWRITFTLAALFAISAYIPLRRIAPKDADA